MGSGGTIPNLWLLSVIFALSVKMARADDVSNSTTPSPITTSTAKRSIVCCSTERPCQTVYWPLAVEKGFHAPLTNRFGRSASSLLRSRLHHKSVDDEDDDEDECRLVIEKSTRGEIRYRLPSIIGNWTVSERRVQSASQKRSDPYRGRKSGARIRVHTFESSFDYYRLLMDKLTAISNIDFAFVDYYSDQSDLADLLSRVIDEDKPWFRVEIVFETSAYSLSIDQKKSIISERFVTAFSQKFRFRLYENEDDVRKSWHELFDEFGTHYAENGRLGGMYALYGKIDCDQSWAKAFDSLGSLKRCLEYTVGKENTLGSSNEGKTNFTMDEIELCENVTRTSAIRGHVEISGGQERIKEHLLMENTIQESFDLLWRDWAQSLREWPSLIGGDLKSICHLIEYVLEKEEGRHFSMTRIDKWIKSCAAALKSYRENAQSFTGQISNDEKGESDPKENQETIDRVEKRYQFKNRCTNRQKRKRLQNPAASENTEEGTVILSVRYDNNDSVCVEMRRWTEEERRAFAVCPLLRAKKAAMAGSATGTLPALNIGVIVLIITGGTVLAIFGVLRTLPAF